jgi:hypothetical protein
MLTRAADEKDAANGALAHLKESAIASLSEDRPAARHITRFFGGVRDALLREHDWNFARRRVVPALDPTAPPGSFLKLYPLPGDCLRVLSVDDLDEDSWSVETRADPSDSAQLVPCLSTEADAPVVRYTACIGQVRQWDPLFLEVFELRLAAKIATLLGSDDATAEALEARAERRLGRTRRIDAREASRSEITRSPSFVTVRR